jgi:hypothetical protein
MCAAIVLLLSLAGCGGADADSSVSQEGSTAAEKTVAPVQIEDVPAKENTYADAHTTEAAVSTEAIVEAETEQLNEPEVVPEELATVEEGTANMGGGGGGDVADNVKGG